MVRVTDWMWMESEHAYPYVCVRYKQWMGSSNKVKFVRIESDENEMGTMCAVMRTVNSIVRVT